MSRERRDLYCCLPLLTSADLMPALEANGTVASAVEHALACDRTIHCEFRLACSYLASRLMERLVSPAAA